VQQVLEPVGGRHRFGPLRCVSPCNGMTPKVSGHLISRVAELQSCSVVVSTETCMYAVL